MQNDGQHYSPVCKREKGRTVSLVLPQEKEMAVIVLDNEEEEIEQGRNIIANAAYLAGITNSLDGLDESTAPKPPSCEYASKRNYTPIIFEEISPEQNKDTVQPSEGQTRKACQESQDVVYLSPSPQPLGIAMSGLRNFSSTLFQANVQSES